jgi:type II secretory pathway pseudopilin PulG
MNLPPPAKPRGFTLVETIMAMASVGVVGLSIFYTLYYGLILFTKNTAMNVSHEEARLALIQLNNDIHSAVSPVSLTDSNGVMTSSTSASAGVEFQVLVSSTEYCEVTGTVSAGQSTVVVGVPPGYPTPYAGMRLIIPAFEVEQNVSSVSISGTLATCNLAGSVTNGIGGTTGNIICFFTQRVYYYVTGAANTQGLNLNYIGVNRTETYSIASDDISTSGSTPFSIPSTSGTTAAGSNYKAVAITGLSTQDPQTTGISSFFGFNTSSLMLSGQVPEYSTLTSYQ